MDGNADPLEGGDERFKASSMVDGALVDDKIFHGDRPGLLQQGNVHDHSVFHTVFFFKDIPDRLIDRVTISKARDGYFFYAFPERINAWSRHHFFHFAKQLVCVIDSML